MDESIIDDITFITLQFSKEWFEVGIITINNFALIKEEYLKGEDHRTEHYRWGAFNTFLKTNVFLEKEKFEILYKLGKQDPDYAMGRSMIFDIIERLDCPLELINTVTNDSDTVLAKHALKCKAIRE
jgi:hypothetical protein